ncbi:MAG: DUF411 domain-containing protein [Gemmatimonadales bacterium]
MKLTRATLLLAGLATSAALAQHSLAASPPSRLAAPTEITVYRSPSCGCCKAWEDYLRKNGFVVKDILQDDLSQIKAESGVTSKLASCHTALVGGYVVEGHVPAADIQRMLTEKPKIVGISAPGMPGAGPGMDTSKDPYEVLAFDAKGNTTVWAKH